MALGEVIAAERREWRREREVIEAQARATIAELRAEVLALRGQVEAMVSERLANLRDGVDGKDGEPGAPGEPGPQGEQGPQGDRGEPGRDGESGPEVSDERLAEAVARYLEANPPPAGRDGADGKDGRDGSDGKDGRDGLDGKDGERGPEGPVGRLPQVQRWVDMVHYEGAVVAHLGASWQAVRDTGHAPPHEDWVCIAAPGRDGADGRSFDVRGTWTADAEYRELDVVMFGGSSFVAKRDDPGPCPGEGWQLLASHGSRGKPGERGAQGLRGPAGPALQDAEVDEFGVVTLRNADGSATTVDLYPVLAKLAR